MPYYVYRIANPLRLEHVETFSRYQDAKKLVRSIRAELDPQGDTTVRLIFAKTQGEAEKLLSIPRDERVIGED